MTWFDILKELEFKGGIVYNIPDINWDLWRPTLKGHDVFDTLHMTLFSPKEMKPFKEVHGLSNKEAKLKVRELLEEFGNTIPMLSYEQGEHVAFRGDVETAFIVIKNQEAWQAYSDDLANHLGIPTVKRFFHVSVSNNQGGNPYKSIGDINEGDVER